ncbi:MAG: hypothetical protein AAF975_02165, partial [Spirochaetota bacterium]
GYAGWAIPAGTKRPEEIVEFIDYLSTKEGKALWMYGIEGENYHIKEGKFYVDAAMIAALNKREVLIEQNIYADDAGSFWAWGLGNTNLNNLKHFGEERYGSLALGEQKHKSQQIFAEYYAKMLSAKVFDGLGVNAFLSAKEEFKELRNLLQESRYNDMMIEAFYQADLPAAMVVFNNYKKLLKKAGMEEFKQYIRQVYQENPEILAIANLP